MTHRAVLNSRCQYAVSTAPPLKAQSASRTAAQLRRLPVAHLAPERRPLVAQDHETEELKLPAAEEAPKPERKVLLPPKKPAPVRRGVKPPPKPAPKTAKELEDIEEKFLSELTDN